MLAVYTTLQKNCRKNHIIEGIKLRSFITKLYQEPMSKIMGSPDPNSTRTSTLKINILKLM